MSQSNQVQFDTVSTMSLNPTAEYQVKPNDYGEVPIIQGDTVLTDEKILSARQERLQRAEEKVDEIDLLTDSDKRVRLRERRDDLQTTPVLEVNTDIDTTDTKREIVSTITGLEVSAVDKRMLTSILLADANPNVTEVDISKYCVRIQLQDTFLEDSTGNEVEIASVGDCVIIQGRCTVDGETVIRSFPTECLQESDVLQAVDELITENQWGMVNHQS